MGDYQFLNVTTEEGYSLLKMNRPPVNALSRDFLAEIEKAVDAFHNDPASKALILASDIQRVFIAGVDLKEVAQIKTPEEVMQILEKGHGVFNKIENGDKPVIAAIQGACLGGGQELAMACHIRIASDRTRFAQPEIALGIIPGFGGTQRLARIVGYSRATEMILTAEAMTPKEALQIGLINRVVSDGSLLKSARETAKKISRHSLPAIRAAMSALRGGLGRTMAEGLEAEKKAFRSLTSTNDMREGIRAFMEKRQPKFTDS